MELPRSSTLLSISVTNNSAFLSTFSETESKINDLELEIETVEPIIIYRTEIQVYNIFEINKEIKTPNFTFIFDTNLFDDDSPPKIENNQKTISRIKGSYFLPNTTKLILSTCLNPINLLKKWTPECYGLRPFNFLVSFY